MLFAKTNLACFIFKKFTLSFYMPHLGPANLARHAAALFPVHSPVRGSVRAAAVKHRAAAAARLHRRLAADLALHVWARDGIDIE